MSMVIVTATICGVGGAQEKPKPTGGSRGATPARSRPSKRPETDVIDLARRRP